jgi:hypothetical protein
MKLRRLFLVLLCASAGLPVLTAAAWACSYVSAGSAQIGPFAVSSGRGVLYVNNRADRTRARRQELQRVAAIAQRAGLAAQGATPPPAMDAMASSPPVRQWRLVVVSVRYAVVTAVSVIPVVLLASAGAFVRWRRPRFRPGLCPSCGYDLRATPARCPECGAATLPLSLSPCGRGPG